MKSTHTPGPWIIHNDPDDGWPLVMAAGRIVANVNPASCPEHPSPGFVQMPSSDNANLIAAAPDLLAAAHAARDVIATAVRANWEGSTDDDVAGHVTIKRLDAVIAKAIGEQP